MIIFFGKPIKVLVLLAGALLFSLGGQAQSLRNLMKTGDKFFAMENYRAAIPYYEQILNEDSDNASALFRAGVSYLAYDKDRASDYLYKAQRLQPNVAPDIEYWLGRVDHVNYRFDDAIQHYQLYAGTLAKNASSRQELALLMEQSRTASKMVSHPKDLFVRNLGPTVNTPYSDHSPVISKDGNILIYTTRSQNATNNRAATDGEYFEDIVEAVRLDADNWVKSRSLSRHLNSKGHDASIQLFDNDTKLLFYRQSENGDFYVTVKDGGNWGLPEKLRGNINTPDFESDAFITPDGSTLYFANTHLSKAGDKDLYVAQKTAKGDWGKPKNLGPNINTPSDEDSPFLTPDGKILYFTSRGHNSMGGYDVFAAHYDSVSHSWSEPENLGYPINSPDDDTYFRLNAEGTTAYLASYRMGGYGEKDIWSIDLSKTAEIKGRVLNQQSGAVIPEIELTFSSKPINNKALAYSVTTAPNSGTFTIQVQSGRRYQVTYSKDGKILGTQEYEVPATTTDNIILEKDFFLPFTKSSVETSAKKD